MLFHSCYHFFISSEFPVSLIYTTCTFISSFPEQLVPTFQLWILFYFPLIAILPGTSGFMLHTAYVGLLHFVVLLQRSQFSSAYQQIFLLELVRDCFHYLLSNYQPGCVSPNFLLPLLCGFFSTIVQAFQNHLVWFLKRCISYKVRHIYGTVYINSAKDVLALGGSNSSSTNADILFHPNLNAYYLDFSLFWLLLLPRRWIEKEAQEMPSVWIRPAAAGEKGQKQFHSALRHHFASCSW